MPILTIHFEKLKKRFTDLNQDVLDSFIQQHSKLTEAFSEALENFLLAKHIEQQGDPMFKQPTEITPVSKPNEQLPPLMNARQKESYSYSTAELGNVNQVLFSEECGLIWNSEIKQIHGVPSIGGKEIIVTFLFENGIQKNANLYINADPRSLWNNIPSQDLVKEYWKPDSASDVKTTDFGKLIAARMRGRSHAYKGTCCDDDFSFGFHQPTGIHFIAVADGAGSAEYSRLGSKVAVEKATETVFELLNNIDDKVSYFPNLEELSSLENYSNYLLGNAVREALIAQQNVAKSPITEKSLSCTLLLAFTLPLKSGKWFTAAYWVGDGAAAMFNPDNNEVLLLGESDGGQYSGETQFLSKAEFENETWKTRIQMSLSEQAPVLFVMTDGVSDPKFKNDAALKQAEAWASLWAELQEPLSQNEPEKALEQWLDFWSVGEHDDRTLAMFIPAIGDIEKNREHSTACENVETKSPIDNNPTQPEITITLTKPSDENTLLIEQAIETASEIVTLPTVSLLAEGEKVNE